MQCKIQIQVKNQYRKFLYIKQYIVPYFYRFFYRPRVKWLHICITEKQEKPVRLTSVLLGCFRVTLAGRWCVVSVSVCFCSVWWAGERDVPDPSVLEFMLKSATTTAGSWRKPACRHSAENRSSPALRDQHTHELTMHTSRVQTDFCSVTH